MQALKTIADSAYSAARSPPNATLKAGNAYVCGSDVVYVASNDRIACLEVSPPSTQGGELLVRDTGQEFTEAYPHTHALALLYGGTLLMARGCLKPQEPTLSAALGFWNVRPGARVVEKVRDAPVATPHGGGVAAWAWHEHDHHFTVALAYADIHCSVQLLTFKRTELRPSKPTVATLAIAKDSNGDASITNMHLLPAEGNPADLRLFLTLARKGGSGRIESRGTDARQPGGAAVTALEASAVAEGRTAEFAEGEVVVVTGAGQGAPLQSYSSQLSTFTAESRVTCLPYQPAVTGGVARVDTHTLALPVATRRGDACVAVVDLKNRLELCSHAVAEPIAALVAMPARRGALIVHPSGAATQLLPKPLAAQVAAITQRKHYRAAVGVAEDALARLEAAGRREEAEATRRAVAEVEAKWATHLLERAGEPEAAMQRYVRTIGYLSVSTVIQKFLNSAHTALLKQYLEAVAAHPRVMRAAYAAVLISLYVQLRDRESLQRFLDASIDETRGVYKYDVAEAIDSCLYGGYHEEALRVAKVSRRHGKVVDICLHHVAGGAGGTEALAYIATLGRAEQEALLVQHGKALVSRFKLEMQVTPIVHDLCCPAPPGAPPRHVANIGRLVGLYDDAPGALRVLCDALLREWLQGSSERHAAEGADAAAAELKVIFHQLLELLLAPERNTGPDGLSVDERARQALDVLRLGWPAGSAEGPSYDSDHALQLAHLHSFKQGLLFLYERMGAVTLQQEVLVEYKDWAGLVALGLAHPGRHGQHLETALHELVRAADAGDGAAAAHIGRVLAAISGDEGLRELLMPLAVLGVLRRSATLPLDVAKDFISEHLRAQQARARYDEARIAELRAETAAVAREVAAKRTQPLWIEDGAGGAGGRVGKSAVYFFCGHVFDEDTCEQRPGTGEFVCAHCAVDPAKQRIRRGMEAGEVDPAKTNEQFFTEIRSRSNAAVFDVVAHHLGNANSLL